MGSAKSGRKAHVGGTERPWAAAIDRVLKSRSARKDQIDALMPIAEALLNKAAEGDMVAIKELGDRLDGKARQQVELTGKDDGPIAVSIYLPSNERD